MQTYKNNLTGSFLEGIKKLSENKIEPILKNTPITATLSEVCYLFVKTF